MRDTARTLRLGTGGLRSKGPKQPAINLLLGIQGYISYTVTRV